jgi:hypothetical protein
MKKMKEFIGRDADGCIPIYVSTCEKDIYPNGRMKSEVNIDVMKNGLGQTVPFETAFAAREIGLEDFLSSDDYHLEFTRMTEQLPLHNIYASNYLSIAEPYLTQLVSPDNFKEIISLAKHFPGNLTSFLGFECRLGVPKARTDWAFAISSVGKDRQVLFNLLNDGYLPNQFLQQNAWRHLNDFANAWTDPNSVLRYNIKCFWLEFDMPESLPEIPIPSIFFGPERIPKGKKVNDFSNYEWLLTAALPILKGHRLKKTIERRIKKCIQDLPEDASLFQVGTLLSRSTDDIRLYINHLNPKQIISYLNIIGWKDKDGEFTKLINELENKAERFVLSFDITDKGIGPRIGIELSFASNEFFDNKTQWSQLLDYLVEKGWCLPEKRDALLNYQSAENFSGGIMKPLTSASQHLDDLIHSKIVRYINHIKIVYQPGKDIEAKAYPAVRLFKETKDELEEQTTTLTQ